jgi:hypothetical protein
MLGLGPPAQLARSPTARAAKRETERLHRGGHLIPITPEGSLRVPFTSTLIDQCPSEGSRDDARCRPLSKERHSRRFDRNGLADLFVSSCTSGKEAWKSTAQFRASVRSRSAFATSKRWVAKANQWGRPHGVFVYQGRGDEGRDEERRPA